MSIPPSLRRLTRSPLFTAAAVVTLGLGLGATAAVLELADTLHFRRLPFANPDRLVRVYVIPPERTPRISLNNDRFLAISERTEGLFDLVGQRLTPRTLQLGDGPQRIQTMGVTSRWAETLGVQAKLGRTFSAEEHERGETSEAVLIGDGAWKRLFAGDPEILGRRVVIDGASRTIVGVLPSGFAYPYEAEFWHPTRADRQSSSPWGFNAPARLAPGRSIEEVNAALAAMAPALSAELPIFHELTPYVVPIRETLLDGENRIANAAMLAAALLLVLVTANIAGLLRARWSQGRRELAVRAALGAPPGRLVRHLLAESAWLAGGGLLLALTITRLARPLLERQVPSRLADVLPQVAASPRTLTTLVGVTAVALLLAAGGGARGLARSAGFRWLRADAGAGGGRRERSGVRALVALQVGLAVVLATATGAAILDLRARSRADLGYDPGGLMTFTTSLSSSDYTDPASRQRFAEATVGTLTTLANVEQAAAINLYPSPNGAYLAQPFVPGRDDSSESRLLAHHRLATPELAATLGLRVRSGRWLDARDDADGLPVVVLSASLAGRLFPQGDALGRVVSDRRAQEAGFTVVGIVDDLTEFNDIRHAWYRPLAQSISDPTTSALSFVVRTRGDSRPTTLKELRTAVSRADPGVAIFDVRSVEQLFAETLVPRRDAAVAAGFFASTGLLLAALGLFALVAESILRRRRELAVRLALGATHGGILTSTVGESLRLAVAGLVPGVLAAVAALRFLAVELDAPGLDRSYSVLLIAGAAAAITVATAALAAGARILGIDPTRALRAE